ncbi:MAG: DUF2608 domain-containing protein [Steroidobacter sp.]
MLRACIACFALLLVGCASQQVVSPKPGTAQTSNVTFTSDLVDVLKLLGEPYKGRTLLVLDIDDTLLTSPTFFGSDAWYEWQKTLTPQSPGYVPCKFDVIAMNYETGTQVPTQDDAPAAINAIPLDKIILTSRSPMYRGGTIRELKKAGYELPAPLRPEVAGAIYEYQPVPNQPGVTVSYHQGVFMVAGQNKGLLLIDLLNHLQIRYDRVVLVDDGDRNINDMGNALTSKGIEFRGVRYTRVDKKIDATREQQGIEGWTAWQQLLAAIYPDRLARMKAGECAF